MDFPRGWTQTFQSAKGVVGSLTVPAAPGVVHIVTSIYAKCIVLATGAVIGPTVRLNSSDGVFNNFLVVNLFVAVIPGSDSDRLDGDLRAGAGASLTVSYDITGAQVYEGIVIQGYDI